MEHSDVEGSEYDLGATSVKLIRVGNVVQIVFSRKVAAAMYYADAARNFRRAEEEWKSR